MPTTDLASSAPWQDSRRRSHARRLAVVRGLRRRRAVRALAGAALASLTLAAGGAVAADGTGGTSVDVAAVRSAGVSVAALQRALGIRADGIYGPRTRRAVRRFQRAHGLVVDGIAGPRTLAALGLRARTSHSRRLPAGARGVLARIAECESGGDPRAVSADGRYRGKYQFTRATWRALGGAGDPARASEAEQDRLALRLYRRAGRSPWPA